MARSKTKRELIALGGSNFEPTDELRAQVRMYMLNDLSEVRIAEILEISVDELRYYFRKEMNIGVDELMAWSAANVVKLAGQTEDPSVALKANLTLLQSRMKVWRIPTGDAAERETKKPIDQMSLAETEAEIARLLDRRRGAGGAAPGPTAEESPTAESTDEP